MGSNNTTIGNRGGTNLFSFTAPGQDSGPLLFYVSPPNQKSHNYSLVRGCKDFTFGLTGDGVGLAITLYFTTDMDTATGISANPAWFLCPAPATEAATQWSNPLTNVVGQNVTQFKANCIAFRGVSGLIDGGPPVTGTVNLQMLAGF
jgi:hypothetical protein